MQAYVGGDPFAGRKLPADMTHRSSPSAAFSSSPSIRPRRVSTPPSAAASAPRRIAGLLVPGPGWVAHPYPVTPYHADYLQHADVVSRHQGAAGRTQARQPRLRARGALAERAAGKLRVADGPWDATVEEVSLDDLLAAHRGRAQRLARARLGQAGMVPRLAASRAKPDRFRSEAGGGRVSIGASPPAPTTARRSRVALERRLVRALVAGCERVVAGYVLRREVFSAEFSQGIENIVCDSQAGFNRPRSSGRSSSRTSRGTAGCASASRAGRPRPGIPWAASATPPVVSCGPRSAIRPPSPRRTPPTGCPTA